MISKSTQEPILLDPKGSNVRYEHAHNDLVEALFEYGYIGFVFVVWLILLIVKSFVLCRIKTKNLIIAFSSLIAQGVCSLGVYVIHAPLSFFMLCLTLGIFYGELKDAHKISLG